MINRLLIRLFLFVLMAMLVAPFILKRENGTRIMSWNEFTGFDSALILSRYEDAMREIRQLLGEKKPNDVFVLPEDSKTVPGKTRFYKWKDKNGEWNFSDVQPQGIEFEEGEIDNNRNVLRFEDVLNKKQEKQTADKNETNTDNENSRIKDTQSKLGTDKTDNYLNKITKTLEDAQAVQDLVDTDYKRKSAIIDNR